MQDNLSEIVRPILLWYEQNRREFPWRQDKEPYHVWVSEIMLQQTRIEAAMSYYLRFMQELPTVEALSSVPEEKLLKLWEGLGYYSRARNLHKAAGIITAQGGFPQTYQELLRLPGIGEYTAGAIASICFGEKVPAVDGNVLRVIARVTGSYRNVLEPRVKKEMTHLLQQIMPDDAGNFNEGLMELGETVCLPNGRPACEKCPLKESCTAFRRQLTDELPVREKKQQRRQEKKTVLLLVSEQGRLAIEKRPEKGLLSGLYQLPNMSGHLAEEEIRAALESKGLIVREVLSVGGAKHIFTHIEWLMQGFRVQAGSETPEYRWVTKKELSEQYALPTAFKYFMRCL